MAELTIKDSISEETYKKTGFKASETTDKLSYTSSRVGVPNYNEYEKDSNFIISGYYNDFSQYDSRLDGKTETSVAGKGRDLMNIDANAYDKIILGPIGIFGDKGEEEKKISGAASQFKRKQWQPTPIDPWGDILSYRNVGFSQPISGDCFENFNQSKTQGAFGGLKKLKEKNPNLCLSLSIGEWKMSEAFHWIVAEKSKRATFIEGILDILSRFPMFDEIYLDWEYPSFPGNPSNSYDDADAQNFCSLIKELRASLDKVSLSKVKISIAVTPHVEGLKAANIPKLIEAGVNSLNVLTFNFFGSPWSEKLGHHCNLYSNTESIYSMSIDNAIEYLTEIGIDLKKVHIGYAGYSNNASNAMLIRTTPLNGSYSPTSLIQGTFESGSTEYFDILLNYLDFNEKSGKNGYELYTDNVSNADYLYNSDLKVFMSIDTPRSVKAKAEYVKSKGLGGLFTVSIDMDHGILVNSASEGLGRTIKTKKIDMSGYYFKGKCFL